MPPGQKKPLNEVTAMLIVLDPGHGGRDRANRGPTGYVEADGVLDIALRLKSLLANFFDVRLTRETDTTVTLNDRSRLANEWRADLLVSVHTNAAADPEAGGIEIFYSHTGEWGDQFREQAALVAAAVQEELVRATGLRDRGIKTRLVDNPGSPLNGLDYYAVIRRAKCPAIIVEAGFHTNPDEEAKLKTGEFRQKIAEAIATGLKRVYGKTSLAVQVEDDIQENLTALQQRIAELTQENANLKAERDQLALALKKIASIANEFGL